MTNVVCLWHFCSFVSKFHIYIPGTARRLDSWYEINWPMQSWPSWWALSVLPRLDAPE